LPRGGWLTMSESEEGKVRGRENRGDGRRKKCVWSTFTFGLAPVVEEAVGCLVLT
jgi:hypothetical protein